jgi:hypothetical protein
MLSESGLEDDTNPFHWINLNARLISVCMEYNVNCDLRDLFIAAILAVISQNLHYFTKGHIHNVSRKELKVTVRCDITDKCK